MVGHFASTFVLRQSLADTRIAAFVSNLLEQLSLVVERSSSSRLGLSAWRLQLKRSSHSNSTALDQRAEGAVKTYSGRGTGS